MVGYRESIQIPLGYPRFLDTNWIDCCREKIVEGGDGVPA